MKKLYIVIIITIISIVGIWVYYSFVKINFAYRDTFTSPDGLYVVDLYVQKRKSFEVSFTGESSNKLAYIVLKDRENAVLVKPSVFNSWEFVMGDFYLDWEEEGKLYFTKFNYIDLEFMDMNCI